MRRISGSFFLGMAIGAVARAAEPAPSLPDLTEKTIRDLDLQTTLPRVPPELSLHLSDWISWLLVGLGALFLLYMAKDYIFALIGGAGAGGWGEAGDEAGAAGAALPRHLALADGLAREQRFVEAMHELLLEALGQIRARLGERLADSLTSREILLKAPLPDGGRSALREIIGRVEWTYFGEHPAQQADYLVCRENFDRLCGVLQGVKPA